MNMQLKIILLVLVLTAFSCSNTTDPVTETPRNLNETEQMLVSSGNNFGFDVFRQVAELKKGENVFISPLSISMALGMTFNGTGGYTKEQMRNVLGYYGLDDEQINQSYRSLIDLLTGMDNNIALGIANSIWYDELFPFKQDFLETNRKYFDAVIEPMDFTDPGYIDVINNWVKDKTKGRIEQIIEQYNPNAVMYLVNAIYFKGSWKYKFEKDKTKDDIFITGEGKSIPCKMMAGEQMKLNYYSDADVQLVSLPYGRGHYTMVLALPSHGNNIDGLVESLDINKWTAWLNSAAGTDLIVKLPRFKHEFRLDLVETLELLGMTDAFDEMKADFSGMTDYNPGLYISKVMHKTFVEVDEEGTEAAAATSVEIEYKSGPMTLTFNRPFIYAIWENNSNTLLFIGKVEEPKS